MYNFFVDIMADLSTAFTMEDFFNTFLKRKNNRLRYILMWFLFFLFHFIVLKNPKGYIENFLLNFFALSIVCWQTYQENIKTRTMMIIMDISLGAISEAILAAVLILLKGNIEGDVTLYAMLSKIIFWISVRILSLLSKDKIEIVEKNFYAVVTTIAAGCNIVWVIFLIKISETNVDEKIRSGILILVFVILFFDIMVFKLYMMYQEHKKIELEKKEYAYQLKMYDRQISEKKEVIQEIRRTKHDMKNNMIYLQKLLSVDADKAKEYLGEYIDDTITIVNEFSKSGNLPVDAVINYKNELAQKKGIEIYLQERIPINLPYKDSDICIILGNLLDNAIEALENHEDINKEIFLEICFSKGKLKIEIRNPYTGIVKKNRNGDYLSDKSDKNNHGIGLKSVAKIVELYSGIMEIETSDSVFKVTIII